MNSVIVIKNEVLTANPGLDHALTDAYHAAWLSYLSAAPSDARHMGLAIDDLRARGLFPPARGFHANRKALRLMIHACYEQGLVRTLFEPEEADVLAGAGRAGGLSVITFTGSVTATTGPRTESEKPTRSTPEPLQMRMSIGPESDSGSVKAASSAGLVFAVLVANPPSSNRAASSARSLDDVRPKTITRSVRPLRVAVAARL